MHSPLKRDQAGSIPASPTRSFGFAQDFACGLQPPAKRLKFAGLADVAMHSPFKRDEAGSIPASRTKVSKQGRHSITDECTELLPRMMRVQISLPLPNLGMWSNG